MQALALQIKHWGKSLGFQQVGITHTDLKETEQRLNDWLAKGYHGKMDFMQKHGEKRTRAAQLVEGTISIISVRMDYYPPAKDIQLLMNDPASGFVSRYALGRDYHKLIRKKLQKLALKISQEYGEFGYRAFTDSAPVMEKPIAQQAGLGWIGKHSNLINQNAGSWFFLGELYTDLPLPEDKPAINHCGTCQQCIIACPTNAIVAPYVVDARRCISYLTIELDGEIPEHLRAKMGNHIYGCDDCQSCCPWNKFATITEQTDFYPRHDLDQSTLIELFQWTEEEFLNKTAGSAIRRIGYMRWLRNIAVALGNASTSNEIIKVLKEKYSIIEDKNVKKHIDWALKQQRNKDT